MIPGARRMFCSLMLAALLGVGAEPSRPSPDEFYLKARDVAQAYPRPAYVVYTIERADRDGGYPNLADSYTLRIWYRASDGAALSRHVWRGRPTGGALSLKPSFDDRLDPGPPTANLFDSRIFKAATPAPDDPSDLTAPPTIGIITSRTVANYQVTVKEANAEVVQLALEARRDPDRNRLAALWLDATTLDVKEARVHDHLYSGAFAFPELFDVYYARRNGLPVIVKIEGRTDREFYHNDAPIDHEVTYTFRDIAFPTSLPDWYFTPSEYGKHRDDLPQ